MNGTFSAFRLYGRNNSAARPTAKIAGVAKKEILPRTWTGVGTDFRIGTNDQYDRDDMDMLCRLQHGLKIGSHLHNGAG